MNILDRFRLDGQVAVITGAGRGIGAAIAKTFAAAGADVALGARTESDLEQVAAAVESLGRRAVWVATDVLHGEQLQRLADTAMKKLGRIDILVNNAGGFAPQAALDTPVELFNQAMRFNVSTAYEMSILCVPLMVDSSGGGSIVNISSVAGEHPTPWFSSYGTAKGALSLLSRELAQEFAPRVRVNAIAVGSTRTDALNSVLNPEIEQTMVDLTPMARLGEVEDVALGALYLASSASSYVTGDVLGVNGGLQRLNMEMPRAFGGVG